MPAPPKAFFEEQLGKSLTPAEYTNLLNKGGWSAEPVSTPVGGVSSAPAGASDAASDTAFDAPPGPAAPPLLASLSPGAAAQFGSAPTAVQGAFTGPAPTPGAPNVEGAGLGGQLAKAKWITSTPAPVTSAGDMAPPGSDVLAPVAPGPKPGGMGGGFGGGGGSKGPPTQEQLEKMFMLPGEKEAWLKQIEYEKGQAEKSKRLMDLEITAAEKTTAEQLGATQAYAAAQAKQAEDEAQFQEWHGKEMAQLQADSDKAAAMKLDSNRMFRYANTGDAVLGGVMMALGAIGGAMAQTTGATHDNPFVTSLNKAIERDLAQQEVEIAQAKSGVARKEGILAQRYKQFGDMKVAKNAAQLDAYKLAMVQINQKAAILGTESAKVNAEKAGAALQYQIDSKMAQHDLYLQAQWKQYLDAKAKADAAAAYAAQAKADKYNDKIMDATLDGVKETLKEYPGAQVKTYKDANGYDHVIVVDPTTGKQVWSGEKGGKGGSAPVTMVGIDANGEPVQMGGAQATSAEAGNKYNAVSYSALEGLRIINEMKKLRQKYNGGAIIAKPEDVEKAKLLKRQLFTAAKTAGENSDKDAERIEATLPDVLGLDPKAAILGGQAGPDASIQAWEATLHDNIAKANATYLKNGQAPKSVKQTVGFTPTGK